MSGLTDEQWERISASRDGRSVEAETAPDLETVDLSIIARAGVQKPVLLCDGMLYRGGLHSLTGPPDCGKTTLALYFALTLLRAGRVVLVLDEEAGADQTTEKLLGLGATTADLDPSRLVYIPFPARDWDESDRRVLFDLHKAIQPAMTVWDSSAAFLARAGLDENSAGDVTKFWAGVLTPCARLYGTAVVILDHDAKHAGESRYARGSGAKLAACDVAMKLDIERAFSRSSNGVLKLTVSKDRRGWLGRAWDVHVAVTDGISIAFTAAGSAGGQHPAERKLLAALRALQPAEYHSRSAIVDQLAVMFNHGLTKQTANRHLAQLVVSHLVDETDAIRGQEKLYALVRDDDAASDEWLNSA